MRIFRQSSHITTLHIFEAVVHNTLQRVHYQTHRNIGKIHYYKGKRNKWSKQIEFRAESNQFEKKSKVGKNEMYSNC